MPVERTIVLVIAELRKICQVMSIDTKVDPVYEKELKKNLSILEKITLGDFLD